MRIEGNIKKYYFYQIFNSLEFFAPVLVLFWQSRGLSMTQIMLLQSIYAVGVIILELPTGALADSLGKRISLILGSFFFSIGLFAYGISFRFWQFASAELIVALGMAFISGADRAFIHATLKSIGRGRDYKKVEGKARGLTHIARAVGNIGGGFIGSISLALTLIATAFSTFISFLVGLSFAETKAKVARKEKTEYTQIIRESLRIAKENRTILWLIAFFALFNSLAWTVNWLAQPYLQMLNVSIIYFGLIFAAFSIIAAIGSSLVDQFEKVAGQKSFLLMTVVTGVSMFLVGRFPSIYIFFLWSLFGMFMAMNQTLVSDRVLALIPAERAATILSFANLLRRLAYAAFGPIIGLISDSFGILVALQVNAVVFLFALGVLLLVKKLLKNSLGWGYCCV